MCVCITTKTVYNSHTEVTIKADTTVSGLIKAIYLITLYKIKKWMLDNTVFQN